jgi:CheY-like chemotaxis protein
MLLAAALRQAGYDVVEALDGVDLLDCIAWVVERRPDWSEAVLVTDVRMPAMGGLEVVARLRSMSWQGPIILITAFGDEATHDLARRLGATRVLDKPFDLDVLCDAIREVCPS